MSLQGVVFYYSDHGECRRIAEYMAGRCGFDCLDLTALPRGFSCKDLQVAVTVYPIYCQSLPRAVKDFLSSLRAERHVLIAAYGRMSFGNALWEANRLVEGRVIAAAYLPVAHLYRKDDAPFGDFAVLEPLERKIFDRCADVISIPKYRKHLFAALFPAWRSRIGVSLKRGAECHLCDLCSNICPNHAIECGKINHRCERCLRCVSICPRGALHVHVTFPLRMYLKKAKRTSVLIFT